MIFHSKLKSVKIFIGIILYLSSLVSADNAIDTLKSTSQAFNRVAESGIAAVVNISATRNKPANQLPNMNQSPFDYFFGDEFFKQYFQQPPQDQTSLGSGVLVSDDGYIVTNYHVIENSSNIVVTLSDNSELSATVIGSDPRTDIAILKLDKSRRNIPTVKFGDSDALKVGDWAIAIGSPFGLSKSMTVGVISATGRSNVGIVDYENFIQTDAAINPGNSGGALLDIDGNLIGINTAIFTKSGGYNGIGFAIPVNSVKKVMADLIDHGQVIRGWIGVIIQPITSDLSSQLGLDSNQGALISDLVPDGPAEKAGLKRGDVIISVGDYVIDNYNDLRNKISQLPVDTTTQLGIIRNKRNRTVSVDIAAYPEDETLSQTDSSDKLGIQVETSDDPDLGAVAIRSVDPQGVAYGVLKVGDIILEINNKPVSSVKTYNQILRDIKPGKTVLLWVRRGRYSQYVVIESRANR